MLRTECVHPNLYIKTLPHNVVALDGGAFGRWDSDSKEPACDAGDLGSIPGLGRSPGEGHGYPLQNSCLENPRDGGAWWLPSMGSHRVGHD